MTTTRKKTAKSTARRTAAKKSTKSAKTKPAATKTTSKPKKKLSALDAAARVLAETKETMTTRQLIEAMAARNLWTSPGGKTPHATLYSAIKRELQAKGKDARLPRPTVASSAPTANAGPVVAPNAPRSPRRGVFLWLALPAKP